MLLLKYNILSYKDSDSCRIYSQYINENMYLSYVLLFFSLFLAYYLNTLLTSCKWFIVIVYLYFIIFCFTAGAYINDNGEREFITQKTRWTCRLADSQDNVNVGR